MFNPDRLAFQGKTNAPFPLASPKNIKAKNTLTNDQTMFNSGGETLLKGVMWVWPVIPLTKCGTQFQEANPAKK